MRQWATSNQAEQKFMKPDLSIEQNILLSRFVTRMGDQAWSFAVPLTLIEVFSDHNQAAFFYFFALLLGSVIFTPYVGRGVDKLPRNRVIQLGIGAQVISVVLGAAVIFMIIASGNYPVLSPKFAMYPLLFLLIGFGLIGSLGNSAMDIAVANDLVPSAVPLTNMGVFNSRLRQCDLLTEVTAPLLAGLLLTYKPAWFAYTGFCCIVAMNIVSFFLEYRLLKGVLRQKPELLDSKTQANQVNKESLFAKLVSGWPQFSASELFPAMLSYSLLWLSVLSPHGVLLTAFLKGEWHVSESVVGVFRGLGALFGLVATLLYPVLLKQKGLFKTSRIFIAFQLFNVILAALMFSLGTVEARYAFLGFILLSRIGLYGFSLGEGQMRQIYIPENLRGRINGTATSLNNLATLTLFALGTLFSGLHDFSILVHVSWGAVALAVVTLMLWNPRLPQISKDPERPRPPRFSAKKDLEYCIER